MSKKTGQLIQEIAKLVVSYKADDWSPILAQLRTGSVIQREIAEAIEELIASAERQKQSARRKSLGGKRAPRTGKPNAVYILSPGRSPSLIPIKDALEEKALLPTSKQMREAYLRLGIKELAPADRARAIDGLLRHLDRLPATRFNGAVEMLLKSERRGSADAGADYRRWFDVITRDRESDPT